jgi:tetratricopeptide (TPR) repeat protein
MALFERAVATDPSYAPALAGLGECHVARSASSLEDPRVAGERARALLRDAVRLAPDDARAQACLGLVYSLYDWDLPRAEHAFELALARPTQEPMVHWFHGRHLLSTRRFGAALAAIDAAAALDPSQLPVVVQRTFAEYCAGRVESALTHCRELVRLEPEHAAPRLCLALMAADGPTANEALAALRPLATDAHPQLRPILAYVHACAGDREAAERLLAECARLRTLGRHVMPTILAQAALRLDDTAGALAWLDRGVEDRCPWIAYAVVLPGLAPLRTHPRFRVVARACGRDFLL